jgi:hypothetical protein
LGSTITRIQGSDLALLPVQLPWVMNLIINLLLAWFTALFFVMSADWTSNIILAII